MPNKKEYALYFDDIGSGTPGKYDEFPYFGLGGIIVDRSSEQEIRNRLRAFKSDWGIARDIPLHGAEIRSQKSRYRWLADRKQSEVIKFKTDLLDLISSLPIVVHGCIVHRAKYFDRYHARYGRNTWEMRKSAVTILVERSVKYIKIKYGTKLSVYFEMCGAKEDHIVNETYESLRLSGHCFDGKSAAKYNPATKDDLISVLAPRAFSRKKDNELLQIADLCLYPLAKSKDGTPNKAYESFINNQRLIDTLISTEDIDELGVKYYCFDP